MKKVLLSLTVLLSSLFLSFSGVAVVSAGGGDGGVVAVSPTVQSIATGDTTVFKIFLFMYYCASDNSLGETPTCADGSTGVKQGRPNLPITVYGATSGDTFPGSQKWGNGTPYVMTDANGNAIVSVTSAVASTQKLTFTSDLSEGTFLDTTVGYPSVSLTFTAPVVATPTAPTTAPAKPAAVTPAPAPTAPAAPAVNLPVSSKTVASNTDVTLQPSQPLVLSGTTVPNGVVHLYIFSTPREATVTADSTGKWTYSVSGLPAGQHHVEAQVTDPKTNLQSPRVTLAAFKVADAAVKVAATAAAPKNTARPYALWVGVAVAVLLLGGLGALLFFRRKHLHSQQPILLSDSPADDVNKQAALHKSGQMPATGTQRDGTAAEHPEHDKDA